MQVISLTKKRFKLEACVEQSFFKTIIITGIVGCIVTIVFDLIITRRTDNNVQYSFLLTQILMLTLYAINRINFNFVTTGGIIAMCAVFTHRAFVSDEFDEITYTLLIALGFICALVSKKKIGITLKVIIFCCLVAVLFEPHAGSSLMTQVRHAIPYLVVFFIVTICSGLLKSQYEINQARLRDMVDALNRKNEKIKDQNLLLKKSYRDLAELNENLEVIIKEKTSRISEKNKYLADIAYANAHTVRGPLARILGLLNLIKLEPENIGFYMRKIGEQANDMDHELMNVSMNIQRNIHQ